MRTTIKRYMTTKKEPYPCANGPMAGEILWFGDNTFTSAIFTYRGNTGRYVKGQWQSCTK